MTMDENTRAKYEEKIKTLLAMAKKKKNVLEYQEISDHFADLHLEEEQMDEILDALEKSGIDVLRITDDDDIPDEELLLSDEDEVDMENLDLSIPDGISIEDPVRMYLKEIGKVPLFSDSIANVETPPIPYRLSQYLLVPAADIASARCTLNIDDAFDVAQLRYDLI